DYTREQFQWLAAEIVESGGDALVWEATQLFNPQAGAIQQQFIDQVESVYQELLDALQQDDADLAALSRRYQQVKSQDYFQSSLGNEVRETLIRARGGHEA
ncbi:MAG TPA: hypothetical protein VJZ27_07425, partial [Aggregatilineales bacterium]|nr:hypothetical protein [Aggregatilineales bacterium]